jgi:high affinity sulfate transporter 1
MNMNLNFFNKYNFNFFKSDLIGGISVAALSLPIGVAYAELAHLPPESGIYTAIFAFLCYFFLGSAKEVMIGPDSATTTLFATVVLAVAAGNGTLDIQMAVLITITTGILMFAAGFLKLGFISNFLSKPILIGYLNGISLILIIYQLGKFTGVKLEHGNSFIAVWELINKASMIHLPTIIMGIASLIIIRLLKSISVKIPSQLILIVIAVLSVKFFNLDTFGITLTQEIKNAFPVFILPDFNIFINHFSDILIAAASVLFVSYTGEIPVARTFSKDKSSFNPNREFFALGLADIVIGFFKGFPVSGADSRSAVNAAVGGKTKMVNIFAAGIMVAVIIFFSKEFALIPSVVFGSIIVNAAIGMFKLKDLSDVRKFSKKEYRVALICMIGVLLIGVYQGILLALVLTIIQLIQRTSKPVEYELVYESEKETASEINDDNKISIINDVFIYRYNSALLFFNSDNFRERIFERAKNKPELKTIIIDARPINFVDLTALNNLIDIIKEFNSKGIKFVFAGIKEKHKIGLSEKLKDNNMDDDIYYPNIRAYFI